MMHLESFMKLNEPHTLTPASNLRSEPNTVVVVAIIEALEIRFAMVELWWNSLGRISVQMVSAEFSQRESGISVLEYSKTEIQS